MPDAIERRFSLTRENWFVPRLGRYNGVVNLDWADRKSADKAAHNVGARMRSIGFFSSQKRLESFIDVCDNLDELICKKELMMNDALLALLILRRTSSQFSKASKTFCKLMGMAEAKGYLNDTPNSPIEQILPSVARSYFEMVRQSAHGLGLMRTSAAG